MESLLKIERKKYHKSLLESGVLTVDKGIPSNADKSSKLSVTIARGIAEKLMVETAQKAVGQTAGAKFENVNMEFLVNTFPTIVYFLQMILKLSTVFHYLKRKSSNCY